MKTYKFCPVCSCALTKSKEDDHLRLTCKKCGWTFYFNPLPSVAAFVQNKDDKILLVKRGVAPSRGKWALPTGFIEQTETPECAVIRELKEETNMKGTVQDLIGVYIENTKLYGSVILIGYEMHFLSGKPKPGDDAIEAKFFPINKLPDIAFSSHRAVIHDGLKKRHASIFVEILKSKITKARVTHTHLFYRGSMGIDGKIMKAANILPGEKIHVLNYNNGERFETYVIEEKSGSGRFVLYGPASKKGNVGDKLCLLSYQITSCEQARKLKPTIVILSERNRIKRKHT
ncbi:MAG: aspartate 1-decarboxylase [bacterium]